MRSGSFETTESMWIFQCLEQLHHDTGSDLARDMGFLLIIFAHVSQRLKVSDVHQRVYIWLSVIVSH